MARARPTPPAPWTIEEFLSLGARAGGTLRIRWRRDPDDGRRHARPQYDRRQRLQRPAFQLRDGPCRVFMEAVKVVSDAATMYPDVVVTCAPGSGRSDVVPEPEIVVEVLSRSTQTFDRGSKLDAYQQIASLKQYVLIAQDEIRVSVYERDDGSWRYRTFEDPDARLAFAVGGAAMGSPRSTRARRSPSRQRRRAAEASSADPAGRAGCRIAAPATGRRLDDGTVSRPRRPGRAGHRWRRAASARRSRSIAGGGGCGRRGELSGAGRTPPRRPRPRSGALGRRAAVVRADVSIGAEVQALVEDVEKNLGAIDVLVNNAGISEPCAIEELTEEIVRAHADA